VVEDQTVELVVVAADLRVILVEQQLEALEDLQVVVAAMVVPVILVEQVATLMNKMEEQEQILVLRFQVYLTVVYMVVEAAEVQEIVNLKEVQVDQVEAVMEN
jgi:predicted RNase H-related nuclease YkuK (DUF458 family)|tara:strand:- start:182 stop:490 length:309 start_codon:yes stop_codon:yes gene_type:complete